MLKKIKSKIVQSIDVLKKKDFEKFFKKNKIKFMIEKNC